MAAWKCRLDKRQLTIVDGSEYDVIVTREIVLPFVPVTPLALILRGDGEWGKGEYPLNRRTVHWAVFRAVNVTWVHKELLFELGAERTEDDFADENAIAKFDNWAQLRETVAETGWTVVGMSPLINGSFKPQIPVPEY